MDCLPWLLCYACLSVDFPTSLSDSGLYLWKSLALVQRPVACSAITLTQGVWFPNLQTVSLSTHSPFQNQFHSSACSAPQALVQRCNHEQCSWVNGTGFPPVQTSTELKEDPPEHLSGIQGPKNETGVKPCSYLKIMHQLDNIIGSLFSSKSIGSIWSLHQKTDLHAFNPSTMKVSTKIWKIWFIWKNISINAQFSKKSLLHPGPLPPNAAEHCTERQWAKLVSLRGADKGT